MAAPTKLLDFRTQDRDALKAALAAAQAQRDAAATAEKVAADAYDAATAALTQKRAAVDDARRQQNAMPADADALAAAFRGALIEWRRAAALQVTADDTRMAARDERQRLSDYASLLGDRLAAAEKALADEQAAAAKRDALVALVTTGSLKDLGQKAQAAIGGNGAAAKTRVEADFPQNADATKSFLARARARRDLALTVASEAARPVDAVAAAVVSGDEANAPEGAKTPRLARELDAAVQALIDHVSRAPRVSQANDALGALAAAASSMTTAQHNEVFTKDAALAAKREAALAKLQARDDAQKNLVVANGKLQAALNAARIAAPDKSDADLLAADPLKTLKQTADDAQQPLTDAEKAITADDTNVLESWFAAMPDISWNELDQLDVSLAVLAGVTNDPAKDLVKPITDKEAALAANLDAVAKQRASTDRLAADMAGVRSADARARELAGRRIAAVERFVAEA